MSFFKSLLSGVTQAKNWLVNKGLGTTVGNILKGLSTTVGDVATSAFPVLNTVRPYYDKLVDYGINKMIAEKPKTMMTRKEEIQQIEPKPQKKLKVDITQQQNENELGFEQ